MDMTSKKPQQEVQVQVFVFGHMTGSQLMVEIFLLFHIYCVKIQTSFDLNILMMSQVLCRTDVPSVHVNI